MGKGVADVPDKILKTDKTDLSRGIVGWVKSWFKDR